MKVLVLPLFQFPTGHLKVAETAKEHVLALQPDADVRILDFLSYCNRHLERFVSRFYIRWINATPNFYASVYRSFMFREGDAQASAPRREASVPGLSHYFERHMLKLLDAERPDVVICTHSFPSSILGILKRKGKLRGVTVVNIYTDFFMNDVWAKREIEYHLVPHAQAKEELVRRYGISDSRIFVTGIPISSVFDEAGAHGDTAIRKVLVSGGNTGLFKTEEMFQLMESLPSIEFTVLCGSNEALFRKLAARRAPNIVPLHYICDRREINRLYSEADALFTKPGGVTVSEAVRKHLPIFIHQPLPGQEEVNMRYLVDHGMAVLINSRGALRLPVHDPELIANLKANMRRYNRGLHCSVSEALATIFARR